MDRRNTPRLELQIGINDMTRARLPVGNALRRETQMRIRGVTPTGRTLVVLYLVDPASSHMLVPKTKPCMSEFKPYDTK